MSMLTLLHYPITAEGFVVGVLAGLISLFIVVVGRMIYKNSDLFKQPD